MSFVKTYNTLMHSQSTLIIGGGVIGLSIAYFLAKEGVRVNLIDKGDFGKEASWAGAGIVPAGNPAKAKSPMGRLRSAAVSLFEPFSQELLQLTGIDNGFRKCGGLEVRQSEDELDKRRHQLLLRAERGEGLICEVIDRQKLQQLEPNMDATTPGAIYFPGVGQVRNPWHLRALVTGCEKMKVTMQPNSPLQKIETTGHRITGIVTPSGVLAADRYIFAGGAWTGEMLSSLGWQPAVFPVKGQIVLYRAEVSTLRHVLLAGPRYLVPRGDGYILAGSTEEDTAFDKTDSPTAIMQLRQFAETLVPLLKTAKIERTWTGLRPATADHRPFLGPITEFDNGWVAAGHFRSGLQLSILTGMLIRDMLLGNSPMLDMTPFRLDRPMLKQEAVIAHAM